MGGSQANVYTKYQKVGEVHPKVGEVVTPPLTPPPVVVPLYRGERGVGKHPVQNPFNLSITLTIYVKLAKTYRSILLF